MSQLRTLDSCYIITFQGSNVACPSWLLLKYLVLQLKAQQRIMKFSDGSGYQCYICQENYFKSLGSYPLKKHYSALPQKKKKLAFINSYIKY
jgi:hypothetical protein